MPNRKSAGYPPEVLKAMLRVNYNEEAAGYDKERYTERAIDVRFSKMVRHLLPKWTVGTRVLELAAGTGYWGEYMRSLGLRYGGIEITDSMVQVARAKELYVRQGDVESTDLYPLEVDTVFCIKAFGFFTNLSKVLENVRGCLRFGGRFINFYYNDRYHNAVVRLYSIFKDPDNIAYQPPWDVRHTWKEYRQLSKTAGLKVIYMRDCVVLPFRIIPKELRPLASKIDDKLTHFGFITMAVSEKE